MMIMTNESLETEKVLEITLEKNNSSAQLIV